jgi:1-acyl-sn-glycerol-3-phosphate acyltransferase
METIPSSPTPKPVSQVWQPALTRLPRINRVRQLSRVLIKTFALLLVFTCTRTTVRGLSNAPRCGAALLVMNHLADADAVLVLACLSNFPEVIGKIELRDHHILRWLTDAMGVIWVHRGQPDRRAVSVVFEGFREGRQVLIAPEGRESLTGSLEQGTEGAAFLALKAGVPVLPITLTGTEHIYANLKRLRKTAVTLTIGEPFVLSQQGKGPGRFKEATQRIMETLARQLPGQYRGVYAYVEDIRDQWE